MNVLLVIADERAICESLRAALPETDLLLFEGSLEKAVRRLVSIKVDAVIIDDAPSLGHQALARVLEAAPGAPTIVLSGRGDPESLAGLTLAGARACVVKPFACSALQSAIEGVTRRRDVMDSETALVRSHHSRPAPLAPIDPSKDFAISQHQMALRWFSRAAAHIEDPRRLSQSLLDTVVDIFDAVRAVALIEANGVVRVAASYGVPSGVTESLCLTFSSGLMRWFDENTCLFDRMVNRDASAALKEMHVLGARLAVPLLCNGRVCGAIAVGEKASGVDYTHEERDLLTVIGRGASVAFEKAEAQRDTHHQQHRLDAVLANITAGVVTVQADKSVAMMNQQAERILQINSDDVIGRSVQKLGSGFADLVLRTLADGRPRLRQEIRDAATNSILGLSVTPMLNANGQEASGAVVIFSKLPEQTISRNEVAYSPFWEYLSERVAQEVKNPMVAINTFAQLLPRKYDSEDFRDAFSRVVQKEVARINNVVETLFDFARRAELLLRPADVNETVKGVLNAFDEELSARSIKLEAEWDPQTPEANLDVAQFSHAVHSIVQNSIEAMPKGGTLKVATKRRDGQCEILIADTGPGIPKEDIPLIFMPFYSTKEKGMGLGLPMAVRIMQQHSGDVKVVDSAENGSSFTLSIPTTKETHENHPGN
jgi:signal transduction histidine kinase/DNA-binding NarL/FixJ family response regulator